MHRPGSAASESAKHLGEGRGQRRIEHPDQLVRWPRRIQQRPEEVEDRARAFRRELTPHRRHGRKRRMIPRREQEADPGRFELTPQLRWR